VAQLRVMNAERELTVTELEHVAGGFASTEHRLGHLPSEGVAFCKIRLRLNPPRCEAVTHNTDVVAQQILVRSLLRMSGSAKYVRYP
jgi:hypothetical protein